MYSSYINYIVQPKLNKNMNKTLKVINLRVFVENTKVTFFMILLSGFRDPCGSSDPG